MSQLHPLDPDDSLTIDGTDLLAEIREMRNARPLDSPLVGHDPVDTEPTQARWKPAAASPTPTVQRTGTRQTLGRPQLVAIALACLLGVGAAVATWRGSEPPERQPTDVVETQ